MTKLARFLKPYAPSIVLAIALLFAQANADLALPDYLSRIVNVGIQQGGVESPIPPAIRADRLERALAFADEADRNRVLGAYTPAAPGTPEHAAALGRYPAATGIPLYLLSQEAESLDGTAAGIALAKGLAALSFLQGPGGGPALPDAEQSEALVAAVRARMEGIDPATARQAGIRAVRAELEALGADLAALQTGSILANGARMLLLTFLSVAATILVGFLSARVAAGFARDVRLAVFAKVENFSLAELDRFSTASLITRTTNDITQLQQVSMVLMGKATGMWWIIALAVSILLVLVVSVFSVAVPRFKSIQNLVDRLNLVVRENLSGMMVIRAFGRQAHEAARFDEANRKLTGTMLFVTRIMVVMMPLMTLVMNLVSLLIIWVGAHQVADAGLSVGDMMAFMQYSMQIFFAFLMMSFMFIILPRASVSGERVAEVLAVEPSIVDPGDPRPIPSPLRGVVRFESVSFRYPGAAEDVLHDVSFTAEPGKTTAIIGTTGAGKSTMVSLVPRFYDCSSGSITIDGIDVRDLAQKELRSVIGFVPQKSTLFSGTVESNLRYAKPDASPEDLARALEIAQARDFVPEKDAGPGMEIAQGGSNVSGGQRQRLAIARALVRRAPVTIFDDSFSALDYATDRKLRQALRRELGDSTVVLVTQRVATIRDADLILVLDEGRIVGAGRHRDLMERCDVYRDIALSQLKQEELA